MTCKAWERDRGLSKWLAQRAENLEPRQEVEVAARGHLYRVRFFRDMAESVSVIYTAPACRWRKGRRIWHADQGEPGPVPRRIIAAALPLHRVAK